MGDIKTQVGALEGRIQSSWRSFVITLKGQKRGQRDGSAVGIMYYPTRRLSTVYNTNSKDPLPSSESHEH